MSASSVGREEEDFECTRVGGWVGDLKGWGGFGFFVVGGV